MNIHPLFVHFPIALLAVYAVLELIRIKKIKDFTAWIYIKASFLFVGVAGALASLETGESAAEFHRDQSELVRMHETFSQLTTAIFLILGIRYFFVVVDKLFGEKIRSSKYQKFWSNSLIFVTKIFSGWLLVALALVGVTGLVITGALGGTIVYGPDMDPITTFVNKLLFAK